MTYTSDRPFTVDGVRLDTLAWNISKVSRQVAGRRSADVTVPGVDGSLPSLNDNLEPVTFGLDMFVKGTDADGAVPGVGSRTTLQDNLDTLIHLFGKRHALLEVRETTAVGVERRAWAKVTDAIAPDLNMPGSAAQFTVGLTLPYGVWEDVATADWDSGAIASGTWLYPTNLLGGTETVNDAILLVTGPATSPVITNQDTGAYVALNATLAAGQFWRVNVGTWSTRYGAGLTLGSADTAGTDGQALTTFGGTGNQAAFLPLPPVRLSATDRGTTIRLNAGSMTAATRLSIRARRKYAL